MSSVTSALSDVAASLSPDELTKKVEEIKAAGNERFLKGDYTQAKALYTVSYTHLTLPTTPYV